MPSKAMAYQRFTRAAEKARAFVKEIRSVSKRGRATKKAVSSLAQQIPSPSLLGLPPEIRNKIWTYALNGKVALTSDNPCPVLPAIATVCRQMLHETTGIFLRETEFELVIQDHDGAFEVSAYQRVRAFHALLINKFGFRKEYFSPWDPALTFSGQPHWMNLLQWCKTIHASKENLGIATCDDDDHPHTAVSADIEIASLVVNAANEGKKEEWETVEKRLEIMHRIAALKDPRWK